MFWYKKTIQCVVQDLLMLKCYYKIKNENLTFRCYNLLVENIKYKTNNVLIQFFWSS